MDVFDIAASLPRPSVLQGNKDPLGTGTYDSDDRLLH